MPTVSSDAHGSIQADLIVTSQWTVGKHMLAARDDLGNTTRMGVPIEIVAQGLDGTPGPNGAPADDDSFSITAQVTSETESGDSDNFQQTLTIVHNPDPAIGTICDPEYTGQPIVRKGTLKNSTVPYTETIIFACQVTYKHGQLTYKEIATSDVFVVGSSLQCASQGPYVYSEFDGSFSSNVSSKGTYFRTYSRADCTDGTYIYRESLTGTWEGSI